MIEELLNAGYENRISWKQLKMRTGLNDRALYQQISDERSKGALILATKKPGGGYYLPGDLAEMKAYVKWARREANTHDDILKPIQAEINRLEELERDSERGKTDIDK